MVGGRKKERETEGMRELRRKGRKERGRSEQELLSDAATPQLLTGWEERVGTSQKGPGT